MEISIWVPIGIIVVGMICKGVSIYQNLIKKNASKASVWLTLGFACTTIGLLIAVLSK